MATQLLFFLIAVAGWVNRHQQAVIDSLQPESGVQLRVVTDYA